MNTELKNQAKLSPLQPAAPSGKELLKEKAYSLLKQSILSEEYPPGALLGERKLASRLGMSKTPIKAALERLAAEGFITVAPQQSIVVRDVSIEEISDHYGVRLALETFIVRTLAGKLTNAQRDLLQRSLDEQKASLQTGIKSDWVQLDADFHLLMAELSGNRTMQRVMLDLRDRMYRVIMRVFQLQPVRFQDSFEEHKQIVSAMIEGKGGWAADLMAEHLRKGQELILNQLPENYGG